MKVDLHSERPQEPLWPRLTYLTRDAVYIDLAVAFVTEAGADAIEAIARRLGDQAKVRLLVSVLFPTKLKAIEKLAERIEVGIHLGYPSRPAENIHRQFHSKVVLIERRDRSRTVIVGSHNWTRNGLYGENLEASIILECEEGDSILDETRRHIEMCWASSRCEPFDPSRMAHYERLQRALHHNLSAKNPSEPFPGFERFSDPTIVILGEAGTRQAVKSGDLYLTIPRELRRQFVAGTPAWIIVFPSGTLFDRGHPSDKPRLYVGEVQGTELRPDESLDLRKHNYLIRDIGRPIIETMAEAPRRSKNEIQVVIPFDREHHLKPIPVFHAGTSEPHVTQVLDIDGEYDDREGQIEDFQVNEGDISLQTIATPFSLAEQSKTRTVPTGLISQAFFRVPFSFVYPPNLEAALDEFGNRQSFFGGGTPCRVRLARPRGISEYVCFVQYRSDADLTRHIYTMIAASMD